MIKSGNYSIFRVKDSFRQVLLRNHVDGNNYDLIFEGVRVMNIQFTMPIERLEVVGEVIYPNLERLKKVSLVSAESLFTIHARRVLYQHNELEHDESSLPMDREKQLTKADMEYLIEHVKAGGSYESSNLYSEGDKWETIVPY